MTRLRHAGLRPIRASLHSNSEQSGPILLDVTGAAEDCDAIINSPNFADLCRRRTIILLDGKAAKTYSPSALRLSSIDQISSLPARLGIRHREAQRLNEAELRAATAKRLGEAPLTSGSTDGFRLLFLGDCSSQFLGLKTALAERGVETVAALSHVTTLDYLESGSFAAIVLHPADTDSEAFRFLSRSGGPAAIHNCHLCLLEPAGMEANLAGGKADTIDSLISDSLPPQDIAETIVQNLLRAREMAPGRSFSPSQSTLRAGGLYSRRFLEAHLQAQIAEADEHGYPLSLISFTPKDPAHPIESWAQTLTQHLRDTDLAARLDSTTACLSLRSTPYRGAVTLARRIETDLKVPVEWRVVERRQFHTLKTLLSAVSFSHSAANRKRA